MAENIPSPAAPLVFVPAAAARALCVTVKTLANWRVRGYGPAFVKVGHRVAYRPQDLQRFIEQNVRRSTSEATPKAP